MQDLDGLITAELLTRKKKRFGEDRSAEVLRAMVDRHRGAMEREARRRRAAARGRGGAGRRMLASEHAQTERFRLGQGAGI